MKILCTYHSISGNTRRVMEAICESIGPNETCIPIDDVLDTKDYDLVIVGFPIHQFEPSNRAKVFLSDKTRGKRVLLVITQSAMPDTEMAKLQIGNCRRVVPECDLVGVISCRGELSEVTARAMAESINEKSRQFSAMRPMTIGHPSQEEIEAVVASVQKVLPIL